jgi:hypothetical protein
VQIHAGDSLAYLKSLANHPPAGLEFLDLLYLDSFDAKLFSEPHRKRGPGKRRDGMEEEVSQLWMIEKEPEHLLRGVRSLRICVGSGGTAT